MVTYLLNVRVGLSRYSASLFFSNNNVQKADPKTVGYVNSGFWAGMAISRTITGLVTPQ